MQVMIVDDDGVSRFSLKDLIQKMGYSDVLEFKDGTEAWEFLKKNPCPIICCCDVQMPKMSGIELLEKVRENDLVKLMPFILVTSGQDREMVKQAITLGVSGYIVKPINTNEAVAKLNDIFANELKNIAETPDATARRLSISGQKLAHYYDSFKAQVDQLITQSDFGVFTLTLPDIDGQIETVKKGCLTLGLWHSGRLLDTLKERTDKHEYFGEYLSAIISSVNYQRGCLPKVD